MWRCRELLGPVSMSDKTSYRRISWSLEAARLVVWIVASFWDLAGTSAALLLLRCWSNFKAIGQFWIQISRLRNFTRFYYKILVGYWNRTLELERVSYTWNPRLMDSLNRTRYKMCHGPLTRCVKLRVAHTPGMPGTFSPDADFKGNR